MRRLITVPITLCVMVVSAAASGQTTIHVPADQPTIQAGIDAAVNGDTVLVAPGTYNEIIDFSGKAITVISSAGAAATIIDATGVPDPGDGLPVVRFDSGEGPDSVLEGFTLTGGTGDTSIGASGNGGGVVIFQSAPTLRACVIEGNSVGSQGGGLLVFEGEVTLEGCTVRMNDAVFSGAAMTYIASTGLTIDGCTFSDHTSTNNRSGIEFIATSGPAVITGSTFEGNSGFSDGAAIDAGEHDGTLTIDRCVFRNNTSTDNDAGAVDLGVLSVNRITNSLFVGNTAEQVGGAIRFEGMPGSLLANCAFIGNTAGDSGGAVAHRAGQPMLNCSFSGNSAPSGSAVWVRTFGNPLFTNCIFWDATGTPPIQDDALSTLTISNSIVESGWGGAGSNNLDLDPLFADPLNEDLSLMPGSPAIDSGDTPAAAAVLTSSTDLAGADRLADDPATPDTGTPVFGTTIDRGAYEFGAATPTLIEQQPSSLIGTPTTLSIFVVDAPDATSFQWFFDGVPLTDTGPYNGTTTSVLIVSTGDATTEGLYSVEVSDGVRTETSIQAGLVVLSSTCLADLTGSSDPNDPSYGIPDGDADGDDFFFYLDRFAEGCP